jgi:hypothetical protein
MTSASSGFSETLRRCAAARALSVALMLLLSLSCGGARKGGTRPTKYDPNVARYRLLLRDNPIDSGAAFRCYGACQDLTKPDAYLDCLSKCPGFEVTKGVACAPYELPPEAACLTARRLPNIQKADPAYKVVAVIAGVALIVALGVPCTSSATCGAYYYAAPR